MKKEHLFQTGCFFLFFIILFTPVASGLYAQEHPEAFTKVAENGYYPFWSPDGKYIVYGGIGSSINVFKVRVSDLKVEQMTEQRGFHPAVSPDGKYITYDSLGARGTLLEISFEDGIPRPLSKDRVAGNFSYWSPDGKAITYTNEGNLWKLDVASGKISPLYVSTNNDSRPAWSPDGLKIAFDSGDANWEGNVDVYIMDADGKNIKQLTNHPKIDSQPNWSPDGQWITYMSEASGNRDIWIMRIDGTKKTQVTFDPGMDVWARWSPDGKKLAFGSERQVENGATSHIWIIDLEKHLGENFLFQK
ncbi:MAG: DPP IV N-terminal domain-containing protein [Candidatus Aminicenantes bacterium]|nr:DPP IV N-terminal domain-containing protein [Candidatus Aminicenantes bacterium]